MRILQFIAVTGLALTCALIPAHAEKRVAVVIGNDRYANLSASEQLQKAVNDARAVGGALRQIGFDVISGENVGRQALLARLDEAAQRLTPGDTAFFFFSGHGVAVDGFNYMLPADAPALGSGQIASLTGAAIKEEDITAAFLRAGARVAIVVLDACRNNPYGNAGTKGMGGEKGLAPHEPPSGVFTFYAASRGEAALDRLYDGDRNPNSVFTRVLLASLTRPDLDLPALAREVREEVTRLAETVGHAQRPAYYDETRGGRIFLAPAGPAVVAPLDSPRVPEPPKPSPKPSAGPQTAVVAPPVTPVVPPDDPCTGPVTASFPSRCAAPLTAAQERGLKPGERYRECENCPEMVVMPAGSFTMGSPTNEEGRENDEGPQHRVSMSRPFAVGRFSITFDEWDVCVADGGCEFRPGDQGWGRGQRPVISVSWEDAKRYLRWLSRKTGKPYRLLSESEREYVTRAGTTTPFWWGTSISTNQANYNGNYPYGGGTIGEFRAKTLPANSFRPNPWGLYGVHGNVYDWVEDCYHETYAGAPADGSAWIVGACPHRIVRGGGWHGAARSLRAADRDHYQAGERSTTFSFRVARALQ